jgi:hypothetical protein
MFTNRLFNMIVAISLLAVTVLVVREANATASPAIRSYTAWAKVTEAEASTVDSAALSYIAQAKVAACGVDAIYGANFDSAIQSYIAWGLALQAKNHIEALCR